MNIEDWHTHNTLCRHAEGTCEAYIEKAIEKNLDTIGLSDHFPYSYLTSTIPSINEIPYQEYSMLIDEVESYLANLKNLKEKYHHKIDVKIAFEIDFFNNQEQLLNSYLKPLIPKLDYIIGSVHVLFSKFGIFAFDDKRFLEKYKLFTSMDDIYILYFDALQEMISSKHFKFDIIGHFDLPKKFNKRPKNKEKVMEKVLQTLNIIKKRGLTIEINTSGLRRDVKEQYPSEDIIKMMHEMDIPILLGSDAHHPEEIAYEFQTVKEMVRRIGYSQLAHFDKRKMSFIKL